MRKSRVIKLIGIVICFSFFYESIQYLFAIGMADITDVIYNTLGAFLGLLMGDFFEKLVYKDVR